MRKGGKSAIRKVESLSLTMSEAMRRAYGQRFVRANGEFDGQRW